MKENITCGCVGMIGQLGIHGLVTSWHLEITVPQGYGHGNDVTPKKLFPGHQASVPESLPNIYCNVALRDIIKVLAVSAIYAWRYSGG